VGMTRSRANRLRNATKGTKSTGGKGATLRTGDGTEVTYDSRHARDNKPFKDSAGNRYASRDVQPKAE
jgi:hypothetical protein